MIKEMQFFKKIFAWIWARKWWSLAVLLLLLGCGYWLYTKYFKPLEDTSFVSTDYTVMSGEVSNSLSMVGTTQFANAQKLTFVNKGRVTQVNVKIGDHVKKGQVLAMITTDELDKDVEKARKNLKNQQLNLKKKLDSSNRELDLLESQSHYEVLLLKQKTLPQEQKLALEEEERKIKDQEKLLQEAQDDYALLLSGKAGVTNADLALSKTVRARNEKFEQLVRDFRNQANALQVQLQAYDQVFKLTDLYYDGQPNVYIGAKNQSLLNQSQNRFWDINSYVDKLNGLYAEYVAIPLGQLTEDYVLSGYTVFKSLGHDMQEWGKLNYEMILESIDHVGLTKVEIVNLAKNLGTTYEDHGFAYQKLYERAVDALKDLKDSDSSLEDAANKVEKLRIELEKQKIAYDILKKEQLLDLAKQEKAISDAKDRIEKLKYENADQEDIEILKNAIDDAQVSLDALLKKYDEYKIIANFDGVVTKLNMQVGDSIGINSNSSEVDAKYIYVETPDLLEVKLDVDQIDIVRIQLGMEVEVYVDALPDVVYTGTFSEIDTMSDGTSYKAKVVFKKHSAEEKILGGMSAMIRVMLEQERDVLVVPNPALADNDQGEKIVRLQQGDAWIDQVVELGISDDANTVVLSGLQEGDVIKGLYINDISMENAGVGQESEDYGGGMYMGI